MALIKLNGSGSLTSSRVENIGIQPVVTLEEKYDASYLLDEEVSQNSYYNEDYVSEEYAEAVQDALATTVQGSSIFVTYFHMIRSNVADRTNQADNIIEYDSVHHAFFKILHFEMKIQGSFEFSFDQEPAVSKWQGTAYTYPYFKPNVGDYFLYAVEEGKLGLFKVNDVKRLSIRSATWSQIQFELVKYPVTDNDDVMKMLNESISDTYVFDTDSFLASNGALLDTEDAETINALIKYRSSLIDYYYKKFYDHNYHHTFIRPDGVHDPYMLEFWYWLEEPCRGQWIPSRLINRPKHMNQSIWYHIRYPDTPIKDPVMPRYCIDKWTARLWETTINSLINKPYVLIHEEDPKCTMLDYPLCDYETREDRFGRLLKLYMVDRVADTGMLIEEILATPRKELFTMFYETPFLIYECDCVIRKLKYKC